MTRRWTMSMAAGACLLTTVPAFSQQPEAAPAAESEAPSAPEAPPEADPGAAQAVEPAPTQQPEVAPPSAQPAPLAPPVVAPQPPAPSPAPVEQPPTGGELEAEPPATDGFLGSYQQHVQVMAGVRSSYVTDDNYRLFSRTVDRVAENFPLVQFSLGGGVTLWKQEQLSLLLIGLWDYGRNSAELRGEKADIDVHRLALGAEARHHFWPWLYAMGRVAPVAVHTRAGLEDSASAVTLYSRSWSFGFDLSAGAALQLYGKPSAASEKPRVWGIAEAGYGWANSTDLQFVPDDDEDGAPQRIGAVNLGSVAIRGPMFRISGAVTF